MLNVKEYPKGAISSVDEVKALIAQCVSGGVLFFLLYDVIVYHSDIAGRKVGINATRHLTARSELELKNVGEETYFVSGITGRTNYGGGTIIPPRIIGISLKDMNIEPNSYNDHFSFLSMGDAADYVEMLVAKGARRELTTRSVPMTAEHIQQAYARR